ncbi:MAG TPA: type II secretion system protein GspK [bacterium]|nr:type II secretion system protein GspK [bacterium]
MKKLFTAIFSYLKNPVRGVAFIIVIVMISVLLPIVTDMNYEAKTEFDLAMNYKRKAEAQALASSAVNFAVVVFDLQKQIEGILKQFNMGQVIEIWDIIPFDTALLRGFMSAGPFAEVEDIVNAKETTDAPKGSAQNDEQGDSFYTETGDPIFQFPGDFKIDFQSEDTKINLNHLAYGTRSAVIKMIEGIIEPEFYDFIFLENTSRKEYVSRTELIQNIVDWVDPGDEKFTDGNKFTQGGDEQSDYNDFYPAYKVKNAKFDTIAEVMMVYGVNNLVFKILEPYITIYSTGKINIAKATPEMIEAIIRAYAVDKAAAVFYNEDAMRELLGKILAKKAKDGFANSAAFVQAVKDEGVELESGVESIIDVTGRVYRIRATGIKEGVESWVEMVVDREGNIYYYREG